MRKVSLRNVLTAAGAFLFAACLTGGAMTLQPAREAAGEDGGITVEELERMSPEDLVRRFCREVLEEETDEETMAWFRQAVQAVEKEGAEQ